MYKKTYKLNVAQIIYFNLSKHVCLVGRVMQLPLYQVDEIVKTIPYNPAQPQV